MKKRLFAAFMALLAATQCTAKASAAPEETVVAAAETEGEETVAAAETGGKEEEEEGPEDAAAQNKSAAESPDNGNGDGLETESLSDTVSGHETGQDGSGTEGENGGTAYTALYDDVAEASELLSRLFAKSVGVKEKELKKMCKKEGWDEDLTMQSFYDNTSPFAGVGLEEVLAACCVVLEEASLNVAEISFLDMDTVEKSLKEYAPLKIDRYRKAGDGLYEKDGYEYLTQPGYVWRYEKEGDLWRRVDRHLQEPETVETRYAVAKLSPAGPEEVLSQAGISMEDVQDTYQGILKAMKGDPTISEDALVQIMTAAAPGEYGSKEELDAGAQAAVETALASVDGNRKVLLETALSLVGKVPYLWGGKSKMAGYDTDWWSFNSAGKQLGLDCSGFVQWAYRTAGYAESTWKRLISTGTISQSEQDIDESELRPGDLGLFHLGGAHNHVGIYIGDGYFIHCSSSRNTVVVTKAPFRAFKRVMEADTASLSPTEVRYAPSMEFTDGDVDLLAKTIWHEARGEGINGWIGVGEVIANRIASPAFAYARDVSTTVYAPGQFTGSDEIASMQPSELCYQVARGVLTGQLRVFGDRSVLFFRNPGPEPSGGDTDWGSFPFFRRIANTVFYRKA